MVITAAHHRRAFTLFELVVVTVIIGIMGMLVVPMIGSVAGGPRVETAADQLLADLEYCQSLSIARTETQIAIRFDRNANTYQVESKATGATTATVMKFPGDTETYVNDFSTGRNQHLLGVALGNLPDNGDTYWMSFNRYGQPIKSTGLQATQNVVIPLIGGDRTVYVTVAWDTGEITITK